MDGLIANKDNYNRYLSFLVDLSLSVIVAGPFPGLVARAISLYKETDVKSLLTALGAAALSLSSLAASAEQLELTVWSDLEAPNIFDTGDEGYSVGDVFLRNGALLDGPDGTVIGEYFSQATIVHIDPEEGTSVRSYTIEMLLEGGSIYAMDLLEIDHTLSSDVSNIHHGAVIGGTGAYAGIRGSYQLGVEGSTRDHSSGSDGLAKKIITYTLPES